MNRGEPSDDLSKIRGEILSSGDPFTHGLIHVPNAHTGKLTPGSGTKSPKNPFFLVHSGGCGHTCADYRWRLQEWRGSEQYPTTFRDGCRPIGQG